MYGDRMQITGLIPASLLGLRLIVVFNSLAFSQVCCIVEEMIALHSSRPMISSVRFHNSHGLSLQLSVNRIIMGVGSTAQCPSRLELTQFLCLVHPPYRIQTTDRGRDPTRLVTSSERNIVQADLNKLTFVECPKNNRGLTCQYGGERANPARFRVYIYVVVVMTCFE